MGKHSLLVSMLLLLMIFINVTAEPYFTVCSTDNTINYTTNRPFERNLKTLLDSLSLNTHLNQGFYNTSILYGSGTVYGQAMCRGDVTPTICQNCVANASKEIMKKCKGQDEIFWYELCQIRYSSDNFFSSMVYNGKFPVSDNGKKTVSDPILFKEVLKKMMYRLSDKADPFTLMFATGKVKLLRAKTIFGLVQCTRDMSQDNCRTCLNQAVVELNASREGGTVFSLNCNARFETYRFYKGSTTKGSRWKTRVVVAVTCASITTISVLIVSCYIFHCQNRNQKDEERIEDSFLQNSAAPTTTSTVVISEELNIFNAHEMPFTDFVVIKAATDDFSNENKLGQGGFGTVYKGLLPNGREVAVKRLSRKSWQGLEEFKNEIVLIAKLQHRNLVRLMGCSVQGDEKLLIYEYMPNKGLDAFIFDSAKRLQLNWETRLNIINGISRGLLYLHEESRLRIIHRDLKPSNVLLDQEMVAKISDFGMARIFGEDQNTGNTRRVVGTYGYMAPEYAMEGLFSVKSDVFSFGVILLEIISGKRNSGFYLTEHAQTLLAYAWRLWNEGQEFEFVDDALMLTEESNHKEKVVRCIHIGLLCVQEDPAERPTISDVVALLGSESIVGLPQPSQPAFAVGKVAQIPHHQHSSSSLTDYLSVNQLTLSSISAR